MTLHDAEQWLNERNLCYITVDSHNKAALGGVAHDCFRVLNLVVLGPDSRKWLVTLCDNPPVLDEMDMRESESLFGATYRAITMLQLCKEYDG